jgi:O-antigen/teichoic acid export membrane protein
VKKVATKIMFRLIYQLLSLLTPIITIPIVSNVLGPAGIGEYKYLASIVSYFLLFAGLGLGIYGNRTIAIARDDRQKLSQSFWEIELSSILVSSLALIAYLIFGLATHQGGYYYIFSISFISTLLDISWLYAGLEDFGLITIVNIFVKLALVASTVLLIHKPSDLGWYFVIQTIQGLLSSLSLWLFVKKHVDFVPIKLKHIFKHFKGSAKFFTAQVAGTLYGAIPINLLGFFTSLTVVGYYSNAGSILGIVTAVVMVIDYVLLPRMTSGVEKHGKDYLVKNIEKTIHTQLFLIIGIMFALFSVYAHTVPWFFGIKFSVINHYMPFLIPIVLIQSLSSSVLNQYLIPLNYTKIYNLSIIAGVIVSFVVNLSLIPLLGIWGAIVAWPLCELIVMSIRVRYLLKTSIFKFNLKLLTLLLLLGGISALIVFIFTHSMRPVFLTTGIQGGLFVALYFVLTYLCKVNLIWNILVGNGEKR